jgi:butyryl-CoA dehydrogenase
MLFKTTEAHEAFRMKIREFAEKEINAAELDEKNEFPADAMNKMAKLGYLGIPYAKEYGGMGLDQLSYIIAVEELSRVDGGTGIALSVHISLCSWAILKYGTEEQKKKYLVPLASGEKLGAFGLTEENAGSDAAGMETTAKLEGDHYILNGKKIFITNAPKADTYLVCALTTTGIGTKGASAFIVEKGWEGFSFSEAYRKMGIRSSMTAELHFNNVKVPKENMLGKEGEGFKIAMTGLDGGRIGVSAQALGIAQAAYEAALEYSKTRIQFGQPIAKQQIIAFKLAEMAAKLRAARMMVYSAAELKGNDQPYSVEAAMSKFLVSEMGLEIVNDAMQIHGGCGYMKDRALERYYRDAKICTIYEGTNEIQRVVVSANIIGRLK